MENDALIIIGRVEGKVDTLISLNSSTASRIDGLEARLSQNEVAIGALHAKASSGQSIYSNIMSAIAIFVAAVAAYVSIK